MAVNIYRVVIGTKTKMCQTFFIFEKKKVNHMDVIQNDTF